MEKLITRLALSLIIVLSISAQYGDIFSTD